MKKNVSGSSKERNGPIIFIPISACAGIDLARNTSKNFARQPGRILYVLISMIIGVAVRLWRIRTLAPPAPHPYLKRTSQIDRGLLLAAPVNSTSVQCIRANRLRWHASSKERQADYRLPVTNIPGGRLSACPHQQV